MRKLQSKQLVCLNQISQPVRAKLASESRTIIPGPEFFFLKAYRRMIPKGIFQNRGKERRTDDEAETLILWLPDPKNWLIGKDPDAGKDWGQEKKGPTEDKVFG